MTNIGLAGAKTTLQQNGRGMPGESKKTKSHCAQDFWKKRYTIFDKFIFVWLF